MQDHQSPPQPETTSPEEAEGRRAAEVTRVLANAARGDEAAWRRLIELFGRRVYALVKSRGVSGDMAEEITQSVFATVAAKIAGSEGYSEQGKFEAWIFRIAMNRVRDEGRRKARHAGTVETAVLTAVPEQRADAKPGAGDSREQNERQLNQLRAALQELPEADREIVQLRHHGGLSFKQIADMLDEPLGTLLARHHRALKKLAALLGGGAGQEVAS